MKTHTLSFLAVQSAFFKNKREMAGFYSKKPQLFRKKSVDITAVEKDVESVKNPVRTVDFSDCHSIIFRPAHQLFHENHP